MSHSSIFTVICPQCEHSFEPLDAKKLFIQSELDRQLAKTKVELKEQMKALQHEQQLVEQEKEAYAEKVEKDVQVRVKMLRSELELLAQGQLQAQFDELKREAFEKDKALKESREQQLQWMKRFKEVEDRQQTFDLELEQKVMARLEDVRSQAMERSDEIYRLKLAERDKKIKDIEVQLSSARRAAEQGSQQIQGEVLELEFEKMLQAQFPLDQFDPVPTGTEGADLVQQIRNTAGRLCGTILWEFKNTKTFSQDWISKLKRDQQRSGAEAAVLVTRNFPKQAKDLELIDSILVVSCPLVIPIAKILRKSIEDLSYSQLSKQGQDDKMRLIYNYLTGVSFREKMRSIVSVFTKLKDEIELEKRAFKKSWAAREKMLELVIDSTASMCGEIEGIVGSSTLYLTDLSLPSSPDLLEP
ncbi:MAG: DUF2130 domain-containing protein [Oligoflexales bacterium]|nr:DUF2130 domain-containing protein [Oligoflexales bacterium]